MKLPSFDDFIQAMGPTPGDSLVSEVMGGEDFPKNPSASEIIGFSYGISLALLKRYHEWLARKIASSDD